MDMEKKCESCGKSLMGDEERLRRKLPYREWGGYCDGFLTMGPDPFAEEIYGDDTEYLDCEGNRRESAMDI